MGVARICPVAAEAVRTLRTSGKTIAYIVENQGMSRASVYRALEQGHVPLTVEFS